MKNFVTSITKTLFPGSLPIKRILLLCCIWFVIAGLNYIKIKYSGSFGTPEIFPFSVFSLGFKKSGLIYTMFYIIFIYFTFKHELHKKFIFVYLISIVLIVLGNMSLGTLNDAFINPISGGTIQYYHDAIKINDWQEWLGNFNIVQENLLNHTKTHPPGAILIYTLLFTISKSPLWISSIFLLISSISIILVRKIFIEIGKDNNFSNKMALFYSVIPAVNIYSLASLDAIIAMLINLILLSLLIIYNSKKLMKTIIWTGICAISLCLVSILTFGALFIWAVFGFLSVYMLYKNKSYRLLKTLIISISTFLVLIITLNLVFNFNYIDAFFTASKLENKSGFRLFVWPSRYIATRLEDILEIIIFLSLALVPLLTTLKFKTLNTFEYSISLIGFAVLFLMFLSGAYRTGETARACLFIVCFVLILLKGISQKQLISLISFAAIQTIVMQLIGNYFW